VERAADAARSVERRKRWRLAGAAAVVLAAAVVGGFAAVLLVQRRANADLTAKNKELAEEQAKVEKRFELAQKAIAKLHTGVREDMLIKSDQLKELRTELLKDAVGFYGELEKLLEGETDAKSRRLLAEGSFQLAELTRQIGSKTEALAMHRKALAMRRELAAAAGADVETRLDVARSLVALGFTLLLTGDAEEALGCFAEQQAMTAALEAESPTEAAQAVQAQSFNYSSAALLKLGRLKEALPANDKAVAILRTLVEANAIPTEPRYDLALSLIYRSNLLLQTEEYAEARLANENAQVLLDKLARDSSAVTRFRYRLGITHIGIGSALFFEGKPAESLAATESGLAVAQKLADSHSAVTPFQMLLGLNHGRIGVALAELGKPVEAIAALEKAVAILGKLAQANLGYFEVECFLVEAENALGEFLIQNGRPREALAALEKARASARKLAEAQPTSYPRMVHGGLALCLEKTGLALSASGKRVEALEACQEAVAIRQKLSSSQPDLPLFRRDLAESYSALGRVQRRAGRAAEAAASFHRAVEMAEQLPTRTLRERYNLVRYHALIAAVAAEPDSGMIPDEGAAAAESAMAVLRRAVAAGYNNLAQLRTEVSLDALRPRADFQRLVKELEEKAAKR
jgi:tetratricopeptide (TPR) repeat protein